MGRRLFPEMVLLEEPVIGEPVAGLVADRPVVIHTFDGVIPRLTLGVALHADVIAAHVI